MILYALVSEADLRQCRTTSKPSKYGRLKCRPGLCQTANCKQTYTRPSQKPTLASRIRVQVAVIIAPESNRHHHRWWGQPPLFIVVLRRARVIPSARRAPPAPWRKTRTAAAPHDARWWERRSSFITTSHMYVVVLAPWEVRKPGTLHAATMYIIIYFSLYPWVWFPSALFATSVRVRVRRVQSCRNPSALAACSTKSVQTTPREERGGFYRAQRGLLGVA